MTLTVLILFLRDGGLQPDKAGPMSCPGAPVERKLPGGAHVAAKHPVTLDRRFIHPRLEQKKD
jgi:hypothetical protein